MGQELKLSIRGLYTDPNTLSSVPKGALAVADNVVVDRLNLGLSRRGFKQYNDPLTDPHSNYFYQNTQLVHDDDELVMDDGLGGWTPYAGSFTQIAGRVKDAEQNQNIYFATAEGIQKLSDVAGTLSIAGTIRALDGTAVTSGGSGFMPDNSAIAYRIVWGTVDENQNLLLGAPSARIIVTNTTGSDDSVDLEFTVPEGLTTSYFYQIYRSTATVAATDTPPEDQQLVIQQNLTAGQITAEVVTITDNTPDDAKGAFLYTCPTQEGILQSNFRPPIATDITSFRNFMFYGNITQPQRILITVIENWTIADQIDIAGTLYTAAAAEIIANGEFEVFPTIAETMRSLIRVINRITDNDEVYAYEIDSQSFLLEARGITDAAFTVNPSDATIYSTPLPADSVAETHQNGVMISKSGRPEAVPLVNILFIGSAAVPVRRIIATQDMVCVLKDDGVFRITGTDLTNFSVDPLDLTTKISATDTARPFNNLVISACETGVAAISVNGIKDLTKDNIKKTLLPIFQFANFSALSYGINYDSDEKYFLALPSTNLDTECTQLFVYNALTDGWTRFPLSTFGGIVGSDDLLYLIRSTDNQVVQERKAYDLSDYADDEFAVSITAINLDASVLTLASVTDVVVGMTIVQGDNEAVITEINVNDVTLSISGLPWTVAAATVYTPIPVTIQWVEDPLKNPGVTKHASELTLFFKDAQFNEILLRVGTNFSGGFVDTVLESEGSGTWGNFPWGEEPWGGGIGGEQPVRTYFPKETTYAHWFSLRLELEQSFTSLSLMGVSIIYNIVSPNMK